MSAIPQKILLTYYHSTRLRLSAAQIPFGVSMTKFVNDAVCEKLDRDQPQTIGLVPAVPAEPFDPEKELKERKRAARKPDFFGPWRAKYGENETWVKLAGFRIAAAQKRGEVLGLEDALEIVANGERVTMSEDEGREIMEAYRLKQLEAAKQAHESKRAVAPVSDVDADFWGDDSPDIAKVRSLVKRHTRR